MRPCALAALLLMPTIAMAQSFPDGATTLTTEALKARLADQTFSVHAANGNTFRLEFNARGHFFLDGSNGAMLKGEWAVEDGKLCTAYPSQARSCNEVRLFNNVVHLKRNNGEIIRYVPK